MREFLKNALLVINRISLALVMIFGASGIIYEVFGPAGYIKLLRKLGITWNYERIWLVAFICLIIMIITYFLCNKIT